MGIEVELKAHIDDPIAIRRRLDALGSFRRRYRKEDYYFGVLPSEGRSLFRLRNDDGQWVCTFKKKTLIDGIEHNHETEFSVSDGKAFRRLSEELGYSVIVEKRKTGASWHVDGVTVEVSEVNDLGTFIELELVLPDESTEEQLREARRRLVAVLERLDISIHKIETRPYTKMIYENLSAAQPSAGSSIRH